MGDEKKLVIVGVRIPFGDLVVTLVQLALAAIPAALIVGLIGLVGSFLFAACAGAMR